MTLTPTDRFQLLLIALAAAVAVVGWLVRRFIGSLQDDTQANTEALREVSTAVDALRETVARLDERTTRRRRRF